ncbi:hypothetical protein [Kutzneria chonburiensis]|uniref:Uncharacterized protein n=1 Tax=Kutzneria chonburiensis TaxID=1483604 RepID=A0ABV6MMU7_9PSEU|nr:hypothetical protein [Kutzneria chonburiensis]
MPGPRAGRCVAGEGRSELTTLVAVPLAGDAQFGQTPGVRQSTGVAGAA